MIPEARKAELLEAMHRRIMEKAGIQPEKTGDGDPAGGSGNGAEGEKNRFSPARPAPSGAGDGGRKVTVTVSERVPEAAQAKKPERTNPNRGENEFMLNLMVLRNSLKRHAPACRERARRAGKWVWRDIRIIDSLVDKVQRALLDTMPERREEYYLAYCLHGHYELVMNGPYRGTRYVMINDRHLAEITERAMEAECMMCFREGGEIRSCPLRRALLEVAPPGELEDGRWEKCEYREAARQVLNDEEVKI
jgi:hypothetical protein